MSWAKTFRLLLLEDQPEEAYWLRRALARSSFSISFDITHVEWLSEGILRLLSGYYDVVLADLFLPDSAGPETIIRLREAAPRTPLVALAREGTPGTALQAMRAGADDYYVKKSVESDELARVARFSSSVSARRRGSTS